MTKKIGDSLPGAHAFRRDSGRTLTGDSRILTPGGAQTATLVDAEFEVPGFFLLNAFALGASPTWEIAIGIDRAQTSALKITTSRLGRLIMARSIRVSARLGTPLAPGAQCTMNALIAPAENVDYERFLRLQAFYFTTLPGLEAQSGFGIAPADMSEPSITTGASAGNRSFTYEVAVNTASVNLSTGGGLFTVHNDSTVASLYVALRTGAVAIADPWTVKILPGGYYEAPFDYQGEVNGIWDVADAAGNAKVTKFLAW